MGLDEIQLPKEDLEKLTKEFSDRDVVSLCIEAEFQFQKYSGSRIHDSRSLRLANNGTQFIAKDGKIETFRELKEKQPQIYFLTMRRIYIMRKYLGFTL